MHSKSLFRLSRVQLLNLKKCIINGAVKFVSVWSILGELEAFRNCKGLSVILSKSLDAIEHFTKVRIVLISHSIIFLNPEIKGFLFLRKLAKHEDQNVKK